MTSGEVGPLTSAYLFSATVNLEKALPPISLLEDGKRVVEPITGGNIYRPGFNTTIDSGVDAPIVITNNGTTAQIPYIYALVAEHNGLGGFHITMSIISREKCVDSCAK
ncbi:hypothetical protein N7527_001890 [Penicillium freii]|nr:hypothetical protein N7527_001890 [Penicillium freii]